MKSTWLFCAAVLLAFGVPAVANAKSDCALMQRLARNIRTIWLGGTAWTIPGSTGER